MPKKDNFRPLSLAQHFEPPDGFIGCFGWMCGYSADDHFLNIAAERFTRQTNAQRAHEGNIALALMLDPGNPQILPTAIPGVSHLPIKNADAREFRLLHAKVAVLGYRHETEADDWMIRLIVSTGNWTRHTMEDSLDLAWRVDLYSEDLRSRDDTVRQTRTDIRAAWEMLAWLRDRFDTTILGAKPLGRHDSQTSIAGTHFEIWINEVISVAGRSSPRFFDNRNASFLDQLPGMIRHHAKDTWRNYIALGSGYYETPDAERKIPTVLERIVETLQNSLLLKKKEAEIDIFVNPNACQAVANSVSSLDSAGWRVREAGQPEYFENVSRSLHAKFIFSAKDLRNSDFCKSAWLYLGSGNLTGPGFTNRMSPNGGNLEAAVVFAPQSLKWRDGRGVDPMQFVENVLPLQWEQHYMQSPEKLIEGMGMPEPEVKYSAAPVSCFLWIEVAKTHWLRPNDECFEPFTLLDSSNHPCIREGDKGYLWRGERPRQVNIRWRHDEKEFEAVVPVIDEYGRVAATTLRKIDIDEAWDQLANFPIPPEEEDLLSEEYGGSTGESIELYGRATPSQASYPVRQMMQLVENIAAKQTMVSPVDWTTWCARLEQCLIQAETSEVIQKFKQLGINPLSPLWHKPFRPDFAENNGSKEGQMYEEVLQRVEGAWDVTALAKLGE